MKLNTCKCGNENIKIRRDDDDDMGFSIGFIVFCEYCKNSTKYFDTIDSAILGWNKI